MLRKVFSLTFLVFLILQFSACKNSNGAESQVINLKDNFYWAGCNQYSTPEQADSLLYQRFDTSGIGNISKVAGKDQDYIWLRLVFRLPENLQNKSLGLFISYLHFSDKVWVNGVYVGGYGDFPPNEKSSLWASHFYSIPESLIFKRDKNIVLIKVFNKGKSGISNKILLGEYDAIKEIHTLRSFLQSTIYLFASGGMFFTALFFFMIFIWRKKDRQYFSFAMLCMASIVFTTPFFAPQLPLTYPNNVPYLLFIKLTLCEGLYLIVYYLATLIIEFVKPGESSPFKIFRTSILAFSTILTFAATSYDFLKKICPLMLFFSVLQLLVGYFFILRKKLTEQERRDFKILNLAFTPLIIAIPLDFIIKGYFQNPDIPYITLFGWLITIIDFIILMSIRYNQVFTQNEYLNVKLRREVLKQTRELSNKNLKLEEEIQRSERELEMAALVQKKFFPYPPKSLLGWDIAVSYSPLAKVSGDMYDYYVEDNILNGFSLFDVSGHGISASLITMLAKKIVFQAFVKNMIKKESVSRTLYEINDELIAAKGEIENYLTGVMFRFGAFDENNNCLVEMANAGHPNPILFSTKEMECREVACRDDEDHHGAIGLDFITVSFPQVNFRMSENDILVFYTDGLTESRNKKNEMFGKERVKRIIETSYAKDAQSIMEDIIDSFNEFTKNQKRDDDITIVVMKRENSANYIEENYIEELMEI